METKEAIAAIDQLEDEPKAQAKGLMNSGYSPGVALLAVTSSALAPEQAAKLLKDTYPAQQDRNRGGEDSPEAKLKTLVDAHKAATSKGDVQRAIALKRQIATQRALLATG